MNSVPWDSEYECAGRDLQSSRTVTLKGRIGLTNSGLLLFPLHVLGVDFWTLNDLVKCGSSSPLSPASCRGIISSPYILRFDPHTRHGIAKSNAKSAERGIDVRGDVTAAVCSSGHRSATEEGI